jgi:hypothetical protein
MPEPNGGLGLVGIDDETQARMQEALRVAAARNRNPESVSGITESEALESNTRAVSSQRARQMLDYFSNSPVGRLERAAGQEALGYAIPLGLAGRFAGPAYQGLTRGAARGTRAVLPQRSAEGLIQFAQRAENTVGPIAKYATYGTSGELSAGVQLGGPALGLLGAIPAGAKFAGSLTQDPRNPQMPSPDVYGPQNEGFDLFGALGAAKSIRANIKNPLLKVRNLAFSEPKIGEMRRQASGKQAY